MSRGELEAVIAGSASWCVLNEDGFALARELVGVFDHVIGDPPYDDETHEGMRSAKASVDDPSPIDFAPAPPVETFARDLVLCAKRWTILFCTAEMTGDYKRAVGGSRGLNEGGLYVRSGIWHRLNSAPQFTGDRPAQGCEALAIMHSAGGKMRWNGGGRQAFWEGSICADKHRIHPTKKPLWLMEAIIRDFTEPGDLIFDPTMGEGTTGEAAVKLRRSFVGCELRPDYFAAAERRIERADSRMKQDALPGIL